MLTDKEKIKELEAKIERLEATSPKIMELITQNVAYEQALTTIKNVNIHDVGIDGNLAIAVVIMRGTAAKALDEYRRN